MATLEERHDSSSEVFSITNSHVPRVALSTCLVVLDDLVVVSGLVHQMVVHRTSSWDLRPSFQASVVRIRGVGNILAVVPACRFLPGRPGLLDLLGSPYHACFRAAEGLVGEGQVVCYQQRNSVLPGPFVVAGSVLRSLAAGAWGPQILVEEQCFGVLGALVAFLVGRDLPCMAYQEYVEMGCPCSSFGGGSRQPCYDAACLGWDLRGLGNPWAYAGSCCACLAAAAAVAAVC